MKTASETLIMRWLAQGQFTARQLAAVVGIDRKNINIHVRRKLGQGVYICGWEKYKNSTAAVYTAGDLPNARRPKPMTAAQKAKAYRERNPGKVVLSIYQKRAARGAVASPWRI